MAVSRPHGVTLTRVVHPWKSVRPWQRHSLVLMVAGLVYIGVGISFALAEPLQSRVVALYFALQWMSFQHWGLVFILAGVLSCISSRWPPISKTWGYIVLTGLSAGWSMFYLFGIVFKDSPVTNISAVLTWGLIAFLWWAISGLINPDDGPKEE